MPSLAWSLEWLNHNSQRNYPLTDGATGSDQTESFLLPRDFLIELDLPIHAGLNVDPARFYVRQLGVYPTGYSLTIGYLPSDGGDPINVATAMIARPTHVKNQSYNLGGVGDYDDTNGKVVIGRLDNIDQQPPGFWTFEFEATRLDPDAVRPMIRGVSSLICVNGNQASAKLYGDVELVAGSNCRLVPIIAAGQDPIIRVDFLQGEGTIEECVCEGDTAQTQPVRRFNGQTPTAAGDYNIIGSECIQILPIVNGVKIVNTCAPPCCSCTELEKITTDMERLNSEVAAVIDYRRDLSAKVETMHTIVLGAKLGDRGCLTCS